MITKLTYNIERGPDDIVHMIYEVGEGVESIQINEKDNIAWVDGLKILLDNCIDVAYA